MSLKDSLAKKYLDVTSTFPYYDTNNHNFKILKAYYTNDTGYLAEQINSLNISANNRNQIRWDSCVHQSQLIDMNIDEVYRFVYSQAFCPYGLNITISRNDSNFVMHFILFQPLGSEGEMPCTIIDEFDKKLSIKNWDKFEEALTYSDFWGMKEFNDKHGFDGSSLDVYGCIKGKPWKNAIKTKAQHVYRWAAQPSSIFDAFILLLKFSGNKEGCLVAK